MLTQHIRESLQVTPGMPGPFPDFWVGPGDEAGGGGWEEVCHCLIAKSSPEIVKYHICQLFLQPGQLMWLHMHGLSYTAKSRAKFPCV